MPLPVLRNCWSEYRGLPVYYFSTNSVYQTLRALAQARRRRPGVIYLSSFFNFRFSIIPQILIWLRYYKPDRTILAPRGEFSDGALSLKEAKKRLYLRLYRISGLVNRTIWHASSEREADDIRRAVGNEAKIIVRENDTDLPNRAMGAAVQSTGRLKAVFVGRIVKIKGLLTLLQSLRKCQTEFQLDVYGPEEDKAYSLECKRMANVLPDKVKVNFLGPLPHEHMRTVLGKYDVMIFPTHGENFGHVIAEALSVSCPVICADVTPWTQRLLDGGGKVVDENSVYGWERAIQEYLALTPNERMRAREEAGRSFNVWRAGKSKHHIFELLTQD